jgi:hypothetical protein
VLFVGTENAKLTGNTSVRGGECMEAVQMHDWKTLSEAASREQDPEKLIQLVEQLNRVLLQQELRHKRHLSTH